MFAAGPEISDLIVAYDPTSLARMPVPWRPVLERFQELRNRAAVAVVRSLPKSGAFFDDEGVDRVLMLSHMELQRLEEEFLHGHRVLDLVRAMVRACEAAGVPRPWRIVDIGCGLGYVVRWLTSFGGLGPDAELVGVDYNQRFVRTARALADHEGLRCRFEVANAFKMDEPATFYISSGLMHHFRDEALRTFLAAHTGPTTFGFLHTDIQPSWLTPVGAWIYHRARMRQRLARHDGTMSAIRAHPASVLLDAAKQTCAGFDIHIYNRGAIRLLNVFHSLVGTRPEITRPFMAALRVRGMGLAR